MSVASLEEESAWPRVFGIDTCHCENTKKKMTPCCHTNILYHRYDKHFMTRGEKKIEIEAVVLSVITALTFVGIGLGGAGLAFAVSNRNELSSSSPNMTEETKRVKMLPEYVERMVRSKIPFSTFTYDGTHVNITPVHENIFFETVDRYNFYSTELRSGRGTKRIGGPWNASVALHTFDHYIAHHDIYSRVGRVVSPGSIHVNAGPGRKFYARDLTYDPTTSSFHMKTEKIIDHKHENISMSRLGQFSDEEVAKTNMYQPLSAVNDAVTFTYFVKQGSPGPGAIGCRIAYEAQKLLIYDLEVQVMGALAETGVTEEVLTQETIIDTILSIAESEVRDWLQALVSQHIGSGVVDAESTAADVTTALTDKAPSASGIIGALTPVIGSVVDAILSLLELIKPDLTTDIEEVRPYLVALISELVLVIIDPMNELAGVSAALVTLFEDTCWIQDWIDDYPYLIDPIYYLLHKKARPQTCVWEIYKSC